MEDQLDNIAAPSDASAPAEGSARRGSLTEQRIDSTLDLICDAQHEFSLEKMAAAARSLEGMNQRTRSEFLIAVAHCSRLNGAKRDVLDAVASLPKGI